MTTLKLMSAVLLLTFYSCEQKTAKHKIDSTAVELNNKAMTLVPFIENSDSSNKAISLLDSSTSIDSNYFMAYHNKLMFFAQLKQFDKAISTINKLIQLKPAAHDLYLTCGILYEQIGDTISSKFYFEKSLTICNNVLDTMNSENRDYEMLSIDKAGNLIMLDHQKEANELLKKLYDNQRNEEQKQMILAMMNKSKKELLAQLTVQQAQIKPSSGESKK